MATIINSVYQHKKFDLKKDDYCHKKFGLHMQKRKREQEVEELAAKIPVTADIILKQATKNCSVQQEHHVGPPAPKRRQTKPLFRPWLDEKKSEAATTMQTGRQITPQVLASIPTNVMTYRSNMVRQFPAKQRSQKEQSKRDRNTLACLINRRNKRSEELLLQQQYAHYQQTHAMIMDQNIRAALYLRQLQQLAMQQQQQQYTAHPLSFVFGQ